jgi:WD40 repeat protein
LELEKTKLTPHFQPDLSKHPEMIPALFIGFTAGCFTLLAAAEEVLFSRDLAPILQQKCLTCHNAEKSKGGYRVDTFANLLTPGKSKEPSISPREPNKSELYNRLITSDADDRMPQKDDPLPSEKVELFKIWIENGANLDRGKQSDPISTLAPPPQNPPAPATYPFPVPVLALEFDSSGSHLFVAGYNEVMVWSVPDGKLEKRISGVVQRVHAIRISSGKNEMFIAGGIPGHRGELALYREDKPERELLLTIPDEVLGLAVTADVMAAFGSDNSIHIFEIDKRREKLAIQQHADWVTDVSFSPDGKKLVSASRDRTVRVYHADSGTLDATYMGHNAPVNAAVFTSDGASVVSAGKGKSVHIWKIDDEKKIGELGGFEGDIHKLLLEADNLYSACGDGVVRQHSIGDRKLVRKFEGANSAIFSLARHHGSDLLASGMRSGEVKIWKVQTGELICSFAARPQQ